MPKKTKKQKIQTVERRKTEVMKQPVVHEQIVTQEQIPTQHTASYTFAATQTTTGTMSTTLSKEDIAFFAYVKKDILSTILFAALSIGALIILSLFLN
jgi:hypothetical protein